jgi:membrane protease YdiL (CAAX protease family)
MIEPSRDVVAAAEPELARNPVARSILRREATILATLTVVGAILEYPLAIAVRSFKREDLLRTLPFLILTAVFASLVPWALGRNPGLALPGAPLLEARLSGEPSRFTLRGAARDAIRYAIFAALVGAGVLILILVPLMMMRHGSGGFHLPDSPMLNQAPGRLLGIGALIAIVAAISEEIQFRLVLFAVFAWAIRLFSRNRSGPLGHRAMWAVTLMQGYLFGMIHLAPVAGPLLHSRYGLVLGALLMPQTWEGVVFGRLYLKRGIEASVIAHAIMDLSLFALAAIGMLRSHFG